MTHDDLMLKQAIQQMETQATHMTLNDTAGWERYVALIGNVSLKNWAANSDTQVGFDAAKSAINAAAQ